MNTTSEASSPRGPADYERVLPQDDPTQAVFEAHSRSPIKQLQHFLHGAPTIVPFLVLLAGILIFSVVVGNKFFAPFNLTLVLQQVTIIALVGIAQTLVILTAGVDLSVGAILVLSHVVMGRLAIVYGWPVAYAFTAGLLCGTICGFINGSLITFLRLPPFIATLGTLSIFGALNLYFSQSETIRQVDIEATAPFLQCMGTPIGPRLHFGPDLHFGIPCLNWPDIRIHIGSEMTLFVGGRLIYGSILMILMALIIWYVLNRTAFGRHVHATGDDPDSARLAGISTDRVLLAVYTLAGFICAVAGWVLIGRIGSVSPQAGGTANLDSITAVVIGGTSLFGGRGSIIGTLIGALIVGFFRNGLALAGLSDLWQDFTVGVLIILAVSIDQWIRKVSG